MYAILRISFDTKCLALDFGRFGTNSGMKWQMSILHRIIQPAND